MFHARPTRAVLYETGVMIVAFQLTFDCRDPGRLATFWHASLGYGERAWRDDHTGFLDAYPDLAERQGACHDLRGDRIRFFLQRVPEPKAGPNRVRPQVAVDAARFEDEVRRWEALGATRVGDARFRDVEGNELDLRPSLAGAELPGVEALEVDAVDPAAQARFWAEALRSPAEGHVVLPEVVAPVPAPGLRFVVGAGPKRAKNRLHLDLTLAPGHDVAAEADRLCALGAVPLLPADIGYEGDEWPPGHRVLRDPEGNELCLQGLPA